jgi:hypothetical protein
MKNIIIIAALTMTSCQNKKGEEITIDNSFKYQVYIVEGSIRFAKIEVDNHEYLSSSKGGMVHMESCKCKN